MNSSSWPPPRTITEYELALVERLLVGKPEGWEQWLEQARGAEVCQTDGEGTIFFKDALHLASKPRSKLIHGECKDVDGTSIGYVLHIVDDRLLELEIYTGAPWPIIRRPHPNEIEVFPVQSGRIAHLDAES
jgi:hypothetical protein